MSGSGYIKFVILLLALPLLALVFLKPKFTKTPPPSVNSCEGSLAANKTFEFNFLQNGIGSSNGQTFSLIKQGATIPYGLIQFFPPGKSEIGKTNISNITCQSSQLPNGAINPENSTCRFVNVKDDPQSLNLYGKIGNNKPYRLFKENNLVPKNLFPWHFGLVGQITMDGKVRNVWALLSECHGNRQADNNNPLCQPNTLPDGTSSLPNIIDPVTFPSASYWGDTTNLKDGIDRSYFLLYVQKDTPPGIPEDEFVNFDLYYNLNDTAIDLTKELPRFVQAFCKNAEPIIPIGVPEVAPGVYLPPKTLTLNPTNPNTNQGYTFEQRANLTPQELATCPDPNKQYSLVMYSRFGGSASTYQELKPNEFAPDKFCGQLQLNLSQTTSPPPNTPTFYYKIVSYAKFLALIDKDRKDYVYYYIPTTSTTTHSSPLPSPQQNLQLKTFQPYDLLPWGWWVPECKPAIYLYPTKAMDINVKVTPKGFLTYSDPPYPISSGWQVGADPSGKINTQDKTYPYLYYESKIEDSWIDLPTSGYVSTWDNLANTLSEILPQLGLNQQETKDFMDYWLTSLPKSPYYYISILTLESIDKIEPLTVNPKPDTTIRVRLYFKPIDKPIEIAKPNLLTPQRSGYTLVEWGGLVKTNPSTPFTCSQ